jgi:hypothetical protein
MMEAGTYVDNGLENGGDRINHGHDACADGAEDVFDLWAGS